MGQNTRMDPELNICTVWQVIFVGANFRGFKYRDSNQSRGVALHKQ